MAISPNKRFVAVAERGTTTAYVSIYDVFTLKKKKVLFTQECGSKVRLVLQRAFVSCYR